MIRMRAANRRRRSFAELLQKAHVGVVQQPDIRNAVATERYASGAHPERPAGVALAVHPRGFEHRWMYHTGAEDLHPTGLLADGTATTAADSALHVHLRRWLGEGEVAGAKARRTLAE